MLLGIKKYWNFPYIISDFISIAAWSSTARLRVMMVSYSRSLKQVAVCMLVVAACSKAERKRQAIWLAGLLRRPRSTLFRVCQVRSGHAISTVTARNR